MMNKSYRNRKRIILDGEWEIIFDDDNKGKKEAWHKQEKFEAVDQKTRIQVPSCWEEAKPDYDGIGWYGRTFKVDENAEDHVILLRFNAVNYYAEVWLNGMPLGFHEGGYTPFEFEVTDIVNYNSENFLVVRAVSPPVLKDCIDGIEKGTIPQWRGSITGGIWQSTYIEIIYKTYVKNVFITPNIHQSSATINFNIYSYRMEKKKISTTLEVSLTGTASNPACTETHEFFLVPGDNVFNISMTINDPRLWTPTNPNLYQLEILLEDDGKVIDSSRTRFGMREFTVKNADFYLNGKRIFLKAGFHEGVYPKTLAYPDDLEIVKTEIDLAKKAGFNTLRMYRKPPPPRFLDLADELGICIICSPPIEWPKASVLLEKRVEQEIRELIFRDRNHPCIIYWELFNEIFKNNKSLGRLQHKMALLTRSIDPTRLILDEAGGWFGGTNIYLPFSREPITAKDVHTGGNVPVNEKKYENFSNLGKRDMITFVSEVGYGSFPDFSENVKRYETEGKTKAADYRFHKELLDSLEVCFKNYGFDKIFSNVSDLCLATQDIQAEANKLELEALRTNPNVDGYCLHTFVDGDVVVGAGILDLWRQPKKTYYSVKEVNTPLYLSVHGKPRNIYAGEDLHVKITAIQDHPARIQYTLKTSVTGASGNNSIYESKKEVSINGNIDVLADFKISTNNLDGDYVVLSQLIENQEVKAQGKFILTIFSSQDLSPPPTEFTLLDPNGNLRSNLEKTKASFEILDLEKTMKSPVVVGNCENILKEKTKLRELVHVLDYVRRGGAAILLEPFLHPQNIATPNSGKNPLLLSALLPYQINPKRFFAGNWIGVFHLVKKHPIFEGLPSSCFMSQIYQNVFPPHTMIPSQGESIVLSLTRSFKQPWILWKSTPAWCGSGLTILPHGRGYIILSALNLQTHLGEDPVADKILYNMIRFASSKIGEIEDADPKRLEEDLQKYQQTLEIDK